MAPPRLAPRVHGLPPILHRRPLGALQRCSKGAQGLSVLPRVLGIFTESAVSLRPWSRQWGDRYAIRAGRNLPDKEFRYLRTVIVTAAVYRGFGSELAPLPLTFRHRAGVRPYTSSLEFAEPCVFSKQSPPPGLCHPDPVARTEAPLLPKLRGQFAEFLRRRSLARLGMLDQSTCVGFGYGPCCRGCFLDASGRTPNPMRGYDGSAPSPPAGPGILTWFPSATALALALGAGSPCADEPCAGTLGLPAGGNLTLLALLVSA